MSTFLLNDSAPVPLAQAFDAPASAWTQQYWGPAASLSFEAEPVNATASPDGVAVVASVGSAVATGDAHVSVTGLHVVSATTTTTQARSGLYAGGVYPGANGLAFVVATGAEAFGDASAEPAGVSTAAAIGSVTAIGEATAAPSGVSAAAAVGTAVATGEGVATPAGVEAISALGDAVASGGTGAVDGTASPDGVAMVAAVASTSTPQFGGLYSGGFYPGATGLVGVQPGVQAVGDANITATGVSAVASLGDVTAEGDAVDGLAEPSGVEMVASVGQATAGTVPTEAPSGGVAPPFVFPRRRQVSIDAAAHPVGVSVRVTLGTVTASGTATVSPDGVHAVTAIGSPEAGADAVVVLAGMPSHSGQGHVKAFEDPIDRAWRELQRKEEDDLMVMLLEIV